MVWELLDRDGQYINLTPKAPSRTTAGIFAKLPSESHDEFISMLREACDDGLQRRFCVTQSEGPLIKIDIVPLDLEDRTERAALVMLDDSLESDFAFNRFRKMARRNEAILRSSMDGFFVVDSDCRFLEVNDAFCGMTGYSAAELLTTRISDLEVDEHSHGGVPSHTRTGLHHFPAAHRHRDGHVIHLDISINVLYDDGEKILVGFARDVTERIRSEEAMRRLTREQQLILDSAADGIAGLDCEGRFTFLNPAAAKMLNVQAAEVIGRSAHETFFGAESCPADARRPCAICTALKTRKHASSVESSFCRTCGSDIPVEYSVSLMQEGRSTIGAVLVFKDLTEQKRNEEERRTLETQIQQAQKLESLGLLAGGVAHDLNNTLVGVQGNACLALEHTPKNSELHRRLDRIVKACQRASKVVQQMLAYAGHVNCDTSPQDMNQLIVEMMEFMRAVVPKSITLQTKFEHNLPKVEVDTGQFQQVVTNLLINAIEAIGGKPGRISMTTDTVKLQGEDAGRLFSGQEMNPGRYVRLMVTDNGCGMTPETLQRIFEPFFSEKGAGRGLGLAAMRGIVRAHHGGIDVESTYGENTAFSVVFPAISDLAMLKPPPPATPQARKGAVILIVDDESEVRDVVKDMLTTRGMVVLTAKNGLEAIDIFQARADEIDVVLLDMAMPGMNGDEVLRHMFDIRPDARVIVSSGFIEENISAQFGDAQPAGFLYKPFTPDVLMERIGGVLAPDEAGDPIESI